MRPYITKLCLSLALLGSCLSFAQTPPADILFADSGILDLTLTGPFSLIDDERDKSQRYDGTLTYQAPDQATVVLDVAYEVRGNWRLQEENCDYAQLWLDLKRDQTEGTLFENQNRLKLVVQCGKRESHAQWVIKEQLAYDIFSEFSELNFDSRLVSATYVDTLEEKNQRTHFAFLIEHQNRLSERFGFEKFEENRADLDTLDTEQANSVALFMLLLGNTDFSLSAGTPGEECCHNAKLLTNSNGVNFPFPYDFDSSGFVDASYAALPDPSMSITRNSQRLYRGYCDHTDDLERAINAALAKRESIEGLISNSEYATERTKKKALRFLKGYFEDLQSERKINRNIIGKCR